MTALGLIETVGYTTAVSAADAAVKAADVEIVGMEKVIGVDGYVGVSLLLAGDVASVASAVEAGKRKAEAIGKVISAEVIPRAHADVNESLIRRFSLKGETKPTKKVPTKRDKKGKSTEIEPKAKDTDPVVNKSETTSSVKKRINKNSDDKKN